MIDRVPLQDRAGDRHAYDVLSRSDQAAVFAAAVESGDVWISGIGVGVNSADVLVNSPDWRGSPELARQFFYHGLGTGQYGILRANVVPGWLARSAQ